MFQCVCFTFVYAESNKKWEAMELVNWQTIISILALFGGPIVAFIGYLAARYKIGREVTLIEAKTIREWTAVRRELETEINKLSDLLRVERNGRRADRDEFYKKLAKIEMHYQETIKELQRKLEVCVNYLAKHNIKIEGLDDSFES